MVKCNYCGAELPQDPEAYLIATKKDGHVHVHGTLDKKDQMAELLEVSGVQLDVKAKAGKFNFKEVIFHNRQRIGDILMFTCGIRDFKRSFPDVQVGVMSTAMHIWDHNPNVNKELKPYYKDTTLEKCTVADFIAGKTNVIKIGPGWLTNKSNSLDWHFANAYRCSIENTLELHIPQGESRPDIWMTEEEYNAPRIFKDPYWLIVTSGERGWGCKMYPHERWQEFVNQNKDQLFIQLGAAGDNPQRLQGPNVIDYVGKTEDRQNGVRDLFKLFLNAEGSISLVSFAMHLSGGLYKPALVIAGAREPVSFTRFPGHRYLSTDGALPCSINACWHCDINQCSNLTGNKVPMCVDLINPDDLTRALDLYYKGGRLKKGSVSEKPKQFKNIVKTPDKVFVPEPPPPPVLPDISKYGIVWGGREIPEKDWLYLEELFKQYKTKTVLEFGAGLSTLLMADTGLKITSYVTDQSHIDALKKIKPNLDIRLWDGKEIQDLEKEYDLVYVNGPKGGINREFSTKIASDISKVVVIHDAYREYEMKWQDKYMKGKFQGPVAGGSRCHLWVKEGILEVDEVTKKYGLTWGGPYVSKEDWEFLEKNIKDYQIKSVIEFGAGLSTLLLNDLGIDVVTYETEERWIEQIHSINPKCKIEKWDGVSDIEKKHYDLCFVDGPSGGKTRTHSMRLSAELADYIIIHDAFGFEEELIQLQKKLFTDRFVGPKKSPSGWCDIWVKNTTVTEPKSDQCEKGTKEEPRIFPATSKSIKVVCTARGWGGCGRSITTIMKFLVQAGHRVEFIPFMHKLSSGEFQQYMKDYLQDVKVTMDYNTLNERCDILFMYGDDYIWEFGQPEIVDAFSGINADKKIMMLNYRRGRVGEIEWTRGWDKYMFLNSTQEKELLSVQPNVKTKVLPPCTELEGFFKVPTNYNSSLRIVRHSSQGDVKFDKANIEKEIDAILAARPDATIQMMPGPSFVNAKDRFIKVARGIGMAIPQFLTLGNLFWYSLPKGYMDMGPRVILEAMASGLPILADNWGGAVDRVTPECGWLVGSKQEFVDIIKDVSVRELRKKGEASRERARQEFVPERWLKEIIEG